MAMGVGHKPSGGRRGRRGKRQPMAEINVTPMVDVMLVLLIIFMVAAPLLTVGVPIDLPQASASPLAGTNDPVSVSVSADGRVFLQEEEVTLDTLGDSLRALVGDATDTRINVRGDQMAGYGIVAQVLDRIGAAGYLRIGLVTAGDEE